MISISAITGAITNETHLVVGRATACAHRIVGQTLRVVATMMKSADAHTIRDAKSTRIRGGNVTSSTSSGPSGNA
jgi:hypothetical protein